jgi:hypothetical protein
MALQGFREEVMLGVHALNPAGIDGRVGAVPNHPRQCASGTGMGHGQPNDMRLEVPGQEDLRSRFPPRMGQGAPIDQIQQAIAPKALQNPP